MLQTEFLLLFPERTITMSLNLKQMSEPYLVAAVGGIDSEPGNAIALTISPQLRKILPATPLTITLFTISKDYIARIKRIRWEMFSAQAYQDLKITLWAGNQLILTSGKIGTSGLAVAPSPGKIVETRLGATAGLPLTSISTITGIGNPDNFLPTYEELFFIAQENTTINFVVENQSTVYQHGIFVNLSGWVFPYRGNEEIVSKITRR